MLASMIAKVIKDRLQADSLIVATVSLQETEKG